MYADDISVTTLKPDINKKKKCKQCSGAFFLEELKRGPYPKSQFAKKQRKASKFGTEIKPYLVCNTCLKHPECNSCRCRPKYNEYVAVFCSKEHKEYSEVLDMTGSGSSNSHTSEMAFDYKHWKCYACKNKDTKLRYARRDRASYLDTNAIGNALRTRYSIEKRCQRKEEEEIDKEFHVDQLNSVQWSLLWNITILNNFSGFYSNEDFYNIIRHLKLESSEQPITDLTVKKLVSAIAFIQANKKWIYNHYHIPGTTAGIYFNNLLQDLGVCHAQYAFFQAIENERVRELIDHTIKLQRIWKYYRKKSDTNNKPAARGRSSRDRSRVSRQRVGTLRPTKKRKVIYHT